MIPSCPAESGSHENVSQTEVRSVLLIVVTGLYSCDDTRRSMRLTAIRKTIPALIVLGALAQAAWGKVDFARDIQPILNANCVECHGGVKAAGDVSFVYQDRVVNFIGDSGVPIVTPGKPDDSELIYRITTNDEDDRMPPPDEHEALSDDEIALFKQWINEGAEWSGHWAFQTPERPEIPTTSFDHKASGNIDRFLFQKLEEEGLKPSPPESPGRLLRRLSLALTGLPPTNDELDSFESAHGNNPKQAVENAVDDLLSRPSFGERWASMWLDLVRYADSGGLGQDQKRTIWAYRDWVVKAFNDDLPFDQFTIKQLAGDLLPNPSIDDLVATASQRNTQTNDEGGTDDEVFRVEAVIDRINTTWQTWGAVTFNCVQCHDHPYDPFRNEEYYQFMAFYNNTADSDLQRDEPLLKVPEDPTRYSEATELRRRILDLKETVWEQSSELKKNVDWQRVKGLEVASNNSTQYQVDDSAGYSEFQTVGTVEIKTHTIVTIPESSARDQPATAIRLTVLPIDPETAIDNPPWGFLVDNIEAEIVDEAGNRMPVCFKASAPDVPWMPTEPMKAIPANSEGWGADSRIHYAREIVLIPETPIEINEGESLSIRIHCNKTGHGSHPMAIQRGRLDITSDTRWTEFASAGSKTFTLKEEIGRLTRRYSEIPGTTVPIMHQRPPHLARPTRIFERGNALEKGEAVTVAIPASLAEIAPPAPELDRLTMAQWWVSADNPLTSRVFVNRLWEQLFGTGIVYTLEDFGSSGEKPYHPALLDYLATRFQEDYDWSIKAMLREIVLSYAFQQSSKTNPELNLRDPDNRLLARGPRLRLTAEMVRDNALAVSGLLSTEIGGPPVHPPIPEGVWRPFLSRDKWETPEKDQDARYRRAVYTYVKRSIPYPTFASFDAPSREFCNPRRLNSNTPLQALVTLNDTAFVECAEALGEKLDNGFSNSYSSQPISDRLFSAYRLATGRDPSDSALRELVQLYESTLQEAPSKASTIVAQVLLNLDETLTY